MIIQDNDPTREPSFTLRNRLYRLAWKFFWFIFVRFSPRPFHSWRAFCYRLFGASIGTETHIYPKVDVWAPWLLTVGDRVGIADGVTIYNMAQITIGSNCVISQGSHLCAGSHDINSKNFQLVASQITLDPFSWICAEAFIGPGVRIPKGCVIGARAVVMKSIHESWTVWAGNPAVLIKKRSSAIETAQRQTN